jgi:hypothetical protein
MVLVVFRVLLTKRARATRSNILLVLGVQYGNSLPLSGGVVPYHPSLCSLGCLLDLQHLLKQEDFCTCELLQGYGTMLPE